MKMTATLANTLLEALACVAISANGGLPENGMSDEQMALVENYARNQFMDITSKWEELFGEKWEIED